MSGTQYHADKALVNELNGDIRDIAIDLSLHVSLKQLFEYKFTENDTFANQDFSELRKRDRLLITNALIAYRLSCIDHLYFFSQAKSEFILNEFIHAYEDFLHIKERNYFDFEEELEMNYPKAIAWINLIETQMKINKRFYELNSNLLA